MFYGLYKKRSHDFNKRNITNNKFTFNNNDIEILNEYKFVSTVMSSNTQYLFKLILSIAC